MGLLDELLQSPIQLGILYLTLALVALILILNPVRLLRRFSKPIRHHSVAIVVLGDVGRSPRMMYHAESFAAMGWETYIVGYKGSKLIPSLLQVPHVRELYLPQPPAFIANLPRLLFLLWAPYKILFQALTVLSTLLGELPYAPEFILVQNPPSIPTLALVQLCARLTGSKLVIDWHNLGYSILALRLGASNPVVGLAKMFEKTFGRKAYAHLFVTHAMKGVLVRDWKLLGIKAVLHDRPPSHFHACEPTEIHDLFSRLDLRPAGEDFLPPSSPPLSTPFTRLRDLPPSSLSPAFAATLPDRREDRPALVVSSTSWTADEDFAVLLNAMAFYEKRARAVNSPPKENPQKGDKHDRLPKMLVIVTGKGPLREKFTQDIDECQKLWQWVRCVPMWLEAADYPLLLGSADLGVSLHLSSSKLDLPMKIVDMFGCGLPVCALGFDCLSELVGEGNGRVFKDAGGLAAECETVLKGFPHAPELEKLKQGLVLQKSPTAGEKWNTWAEEWDRVVKPIVTHRPGVE